MSGKSHRSLPKKRHHSERIRLFPGAKLERWTNAKSAWIAFHLGQQMSAVDIAAQMRDGTSPPTIRRMSKLWNLPVKGMRRGVVVCLPRHIRVRLEKVAARRGITPERYLDRICLHAIRDDMFDAIVDEGGND